MSKQAPNQVSNQEDVNDDYKVIQFERGGSIIRVYILKPGQVFKRFGGSSSGLLVRKTPSLIVTQSGISGRVDIEYDVHDLRVWKGIFSSIMSSMAE